MMFRKFRILAVVILLIVSNSHASDNAGHVVKQTIRLDDISLHYEFADAQSVAKQPAFTKTIHAGIQHYRKLFGGYPRDLQGKTYTEITVRIRQGKHSSGEADPQLLLLTWSDSKLFGLHSWQTLLLHEIFHLWSAESFRYHDGREHWFNEGFSEFYTFKAATELGFISAHDALTIASMPLGFYSSSERLGRLSMREAASNNKAKFDNYFLVYHGGWVAAMVLDHDIRSRTANQHSLDDVMRMLYQHYPRHKTLYRSEDLVVVLKTTSGLDYKEFFKRYIDGIERIPVAEHFDLGKALWDFEFNPAKRHQHEYLYRALGITSVNNNFMGK
ncbi:hypothetical protein ORJ04_06955 [Rheinheimera baltica]|uniref:Peptidase M61 catalytic domain-containing protein n=2 Tax=Rheinheimera baltica TaxID=67576 RepID=A0ABT9HX33_9GAMM|nr:hypothetical protein [Rheinheimera baltica]